MLDDAHDDVDFQFPDSVKNWFTHMYTHMISGNIKEMERLYDIEFGLLTTNYFKTSPWPAPESITSLLQDDEAFVLLYTQIYYRHLFSRLQPSMERKVDSWRNYVNLFDGILDGSIELDALPPSWVFDIIGEFVYQYQSFCQYRAKIASKNESEIAAYREHHDIWDTLAVLSYLHRLVRHSNIQDHLSSSSSSVEDETPACLDTDDTLLLLGYFAMIGLARANVLYGDYYTSIQHLALIDFGKKGIYTKAASCHVSTLYHLGYAQLMLQRYADAIRSFSELVLLVTRNRSLYSRLAQYEQLTKIADKGLGLLALTMALCPAQRVDDQINSLLRDKYSDKITKLQKGQVDTFSDIFAYASPKFILPTCGGGAHEATPEVNRSQEALALQLQVFTSLVKSQDQIPILREILRLYQSISLPKLANFQDTTEDVIRSRLILFKYLSHQMQNKQLGLDMHDGVVSATSDVQFVISQDMVTIEEQKPQHRSLDFFMTRIKKFSNIIQTGRKA